MEARAKAVGIPFGPPTMPESLRAYITRHSPTSSAYSATSEANPFLGKHVLVLSGGADRLVPYSFSQPFVDALTVGEKGVKHVVVQEGAGHEVTPQMHVEASEFVRQWLLK